MAESLWSVCCIVNIQCMGCTEPETRQPTTEIVSLSWKRMSNKPYLISNILTLGMMCIEMQRSRSMRHCAKDRPHNNESNTNKPLKNYPDAASGINSQPAF